MKTLEILHVVVTQKNKVKKNPNPNLFDNLTAR